MEELAQKRQELRRLRTGHNFDTKYKDKGGLAKLKRMIAARDTLQDMAGVFRLSPQRMSAIIYATTGQRYTDHLIAHDTVRQHIPRRHKTKT
jgi:hypothetical protein